MMKISTTIAIVAALFHKNLTQTSAFTAVARPQFTTPSATQLQYSIVYPDGDSSETKKEVPNETGSIGVHNVDRKPKASAPCEISQKNQDGSVASFEGYKDFDETDPENAVYDYVDSAGYEK